MSNKTFYRISLEECKKLEEEERASWALEARKSASNQRRFDTLTPLIEKYYSNKMATERESRAAVTPDEWAQYQETKCLPKPPKMPPFMREQFTKYNALLRSADRRVNRAENSTAARESARISRSHLPNYKSPYRLAEQDYDHALIILEELLRCEPNARQFLDRPVYFEYDHPDTANPDQDSVPRLLNCSSPYRRREGEHYPSNSELRLSTLLASRNKLIDVA
jgi:hypothetical protein